MALRLIEMVVKQTIGEEIQQFLKECKVLQHRLIQLENEEVLVRILLDAEKNEKVLDFLEKQYSNNEENRAIVLPVEATIPRIKDPPPVPSEVLPERIGREELYEDIKSVAKCTKVYIIMTALSSIVASVGLYQSSLVILIGSMVIAPSIGPSMALSLATSLGDLPLLHRSFLTGLAGVTITFILSVIIGSLVPLDINSAEVASRTHASFGDLTVAFMSGCAGALAFTTGVSTILIGVMVAVSLLPPLVTFGMLLGGGQISPAMGALSLFFMNMICVNLSGIITFVAQGIHPLKGKEEKIAKKAIFISSALLAFMLFTLCMLIWKLKI